MEVIKGGERTVILKENFDPRIHERVPVEEVSSKDENETSWRTLGLSESVSAALYEAGITPGSEAPSRLDLLSIDGVGKATAGEVLGYYTKRDEGK